MGREENIRVFQDTENICKTNEKIKKSIEKATSLQKMIPEGEKLEVKDLNLYSKRARVVVSKKRTFEAASGYKEGHIAVLNFASASNPGGGVLKGSVAQEECLCRCSGLYFSLDTDSMWKQFYLPHRRSLNPLHNDDIIYTPSVTVFKSDTMVPNLLEENDWYEVDVITCAAPNLRLNPTNMWNPSDGGSVTISDEDLLTLHEKRLRRILDVAVLNNVDTIILGAFGCGAFKNKPEVVSRAHRRVLKDYLYAFKHIEYAIYCRNKYDENFRDFEHEMRIYRS